MVPDNNTENRGSPIKDSKNVILEPIQVAESSLTPLKTGNKLDSQTRQVHKKSMKKVLQPLQR